MSAGYISKIELENFMSHKKFEIDLSPNMNIIVGRNGSGKSSILTALIVALGGGARATGRGENFKALIRHGCSDAYITLTIRNLRGGPSLERFGPVFTIQRRLGTKSSSYSIKDGSGRTISTKVQDIRNICFHFGFHPDNTLIMLNQENAKEFLVTATPTVKYARLRKALQVDSFELSIEEAEIYIDQRHKWKEQIERDLEALKVEAKSEESIIASARQIHNATNAISDLKAVVAWRNVRKLETKAARAREDVASAAAEYNNLETADFGNQIREITDYLATIEAEKDIQVPKLTSETQKLEPLQKQVQVAKKRVTEVERASERATSDLSKAKTNLKELLKGQSTKSDGDLAKLYDEQKQLNTERVELMAQEETLEAKIQDLDTSRQEKKQQIRGLEGEIKAVKSSIDHENTMLQTQKNGPSNPLMGYGRYARDLRALDSLIEQNAGKFKAKPVGPLGKYVKCTDQKWAKLIETVSRNVMWMYWVQSREDRDLLLAFAKKARIDRKITTLLWEAELFEYRQVPRNENYTRLLDCIKFEHQYVERIYIDHVSLERDVFAYSMNEGLKISENRQFGYVYIESKDKTGWRRLSHNSVGNRENSTIFPGHNRVYIETAVDSPEAARRAIEDRIKEYQEAKDQLEENLTKIADEEDQLNSQLGRLNTEKDEAREKRKEIDSNLKKVAAKIDKLETADDEEIDIETLSRNHERAVEQRTIEVNSTKVLLKARTAELSKAESALAAQELAIQECSKVTEELEKQIRAQDMKLQKLHNSQTNHAATKAALERRLMEFEASVEELEDELEQETEKASSVGARPVLEDFDERNNSQIGTEIIRLEAQREQLMQANIDLERREQELRQVTEDIERVSEEFKRQRKDVESLVENSKRRKLNAKRQFTLKMNQISKAYEEYIAERNFTGKLKIKPNEGTLEATANPQRAGGDSSRDTATLSGGEKSFTQICLLLSVWSNISTGLVAMDEYDVFMDEVFRAASMEALVRTITGKQAQGILITPQGLPRAIVDKYQDTDVFVVHNLESPR